MKTILFIYGTRPEAIKVAPLIKKIKEYPAIFNTKICLTGQHRQMLDQINNFFDISYDYDLNLMSANQTLYDITSRCLLGLRGVLEEVIPDLIFVQGDTTSVLAGALAGFYQHVPIAHLEAGLRTGNKYSPFPEEINRIITSHIADFHFAPTIKAVKNLELEGINKNVFLVGNTVIDALYLGLNIIENKGDEIYRKHFSFLDFNKKIILITGHRRENWGKGFDEICKAIKEVAREYSDIEFVYPVHLNPNVKEPVYRILSDVKNIYLIEPLNYPYLIWLMNKSYLIVTDSGGIQEEAPALGKPVLVMREVTERPEGIEAGTARLIGIKFDNIVKNIKELIIDKESYNRMSNSVNPYGDGNTSKKIVHILMEILKE